LRGDVVLPKGARAQGRRRGCTGQGSDSIFVWTAVAAAKEFAAKQKMAAAELGWPR